MEFEPKQIVFRDVRLNQSYTLSLCITNPLQSAVEFTLRSSNSVRYTITPSHIKLQSKQSIVVTIRLFLNYYPNIQKGSNQGQEDSIQIKSTYFDQKIPLQFFLHSSNIRSRSLSPRITSSSSTINSNRINNKVNFNTNNKKEGSNSDRSDLLNELNNKIKDQDNYINELKDVITNLESKHPKWQEIINSKLKKEREIFDEKSNKILSILSNKDELIQSLQSQLEENMKVLQNRNNTSDSNNNSIIIQQKEQIDNLIKELDHHKNHIVSITTINSDLKQEVTNINNNIKDLQIKQTLLTNELTTEKNKSLVRFVPQQLQELRSLREQTIDQSEQIEVLVSEINKMRLESNEYHNISEDLKKANYEINRLKDDLVYQQQKYLDLQHINSDIQKSYEQLRDEFQTYQLNTPTTNNSMNNMQNISNNMQNSLQNVSNTIQRRSVSWQQPTNQHIYMDGRAYETQIGSSSIGLSMNENQLSSQTSGDNIATSTPTNFTLGGSNSQTIQEKNEMIVLYQEKLYRYENDLEQLKARLHDSETTERDLRSSYHELENRFKTLDQDNNLLHDRVNRLKNEKESLELSYQAKEIDLQNALVKVTNQNETNDNLEAHVWWSYIWHALKQQQTQAQASSNVVSTTIPNNNNNNTIIGMISESTHMNDKAPVVYPGNYDYVPPHEAASKVHENRLRENLRSQAIEIANLRQVSYYLLLFLFIILILKVESIVCMIFFVIYHILYTFINRMHYLKS